MSQESPSATRKSRLREGWVKTHPSRLHRPLQKRATRPSLNTLPKDFGWEFLTRLYRSLCVGLPGEFDEQFRIVLKKRDAAAYHSLRERWGLQRINSDVTFRLPQWDARRVQLLVSVMKKDPCFESVSSSERKKRCIEQVLECEAKLASFQKLDESDLVVVTWKRIIKEILGPFPGINDIVVDGKHGPGTAIGISFDMTSSYFKYATWPYKVTRQALDYMRQAIETDQRWKGALEDSYRYRFGIPAWRLLDWDTFWDNVFDIVPGNKITCVPKDGTKDRPIAIEPVGNIYLQLAFDRAIRLRLRLAGLDLDDQDPNRVLARRGSADLTPLSPATLDLSNASDTISYELVKQVLPGDWFAGLDAVRSPQGLLPSGEQIHYVKMSSMGNGSTFVLESLLFYSLTLAISCCYGQYSDRKSIRAYGDDIIVPSYLARTLTSYLGRCGFIVNQSKSFYEGPVRESCGGDYYQGENIRPVFFKTPESILDLIGLRNRLHRWFVCHLGTGIDPSLDRWLLSFYRGGLVLGPENDCETDSYIHACQQNIVGPCLMAVTKKSSGKEFFFRRLMHTLRACDGPGGAFVITRRGEANYKVVVRPLLFEPYQLEGRVQDYDRPDWDPVYAVPPCEEKFFLWEGGSDTTPVG